MALGLWCSKHKINYVCKTQQQCRFPEITTRLLEINYRPCCGQFHVGTVFFLQIIAQSETVHLPMDERFVFMTAQDVNINSILVSEPLSMTRCMCSLCAVIRTENCSHMKLLTTSSVDYLHLHVHDFWKKTFLWRFAKCPFWVFWAPQAERHLVPLYSRVVRRLYGRCLQNVATRIKTI